MDELRVDDRPGRGPRLHQGDEDVDQLAGLGADQGRAQHPLGLRIDEDLHLAGGFVRLHRPGDVAEGHAGALEGDAALARLFLRQADPGNLWIGEGRVGDEALEPVPARTAQQDLEEKAVIVPAGVRELRSAEDVADGVDPFGAGPVLAVGDHEALLVESDSRLLATEVVGIGPPADRDQQMRPPQTLAVAERQRDLSGASFDARGPGAQLQRDLLRPEDALQGRGDLRVLAGHEVRERVDDGHPRPEPAEHLTELAADVATAEHEQVLRELAQLHHRRVVEPWRLDQTFYRWHERPRADVDDHDLRAVHLAADLHLPFADEPRLTVDDGQAVDLETLAHGLAPPPHDRILAVHHGREVDGHLPGVHSQPACGAGDVGGARARDHRLDRKSVV